MRFEQGASPPPVDGVNQPGAPSSYSPPAPGPATLLPPPASSPRDASEDATPYSYPPQPPPASAEQPSLTDATYPTATQPNLAPNGVSESPTGTHPVMRKPWYTALPKPLPRWAFIGSIVAVILVFAVLLLMGSDWAAGAVPVGIVAGSLALVVLLVTGVRMLLGMVAKTNPKRVTQLISAGLSILLLSLLCLVGLTQQSAIHSVQAHAWEWQQQWQSSINEYQLAGESVPTSENIARVYNEWGEQFSAQQHYQNAIAKFTIVINKYASASTGVARAQSDTLRSYLAWGQQASQQHDYAGATSHYDALLQLTYCTASCQSQGNALDATAYYNLAESQLAVKHYADAVNNFQNLVSRFASSPETHQIHADYAKALQGHGREQLATSCTSAVPTYQQLSTRFGDTPEGQQATRALKAPQPVKGRFTSVVPHDPGLRPVAALMQAIYNNMPASLFFQILSGSPRVTIQSNGTFSFSPQKQGTYILTWGTDRSDGTQSYVTAFNNDGSPIYVAKVGPLCPFDFGTINEDIPTK
jgi:hypothetical protein